MKVFNIIKVYEINNSDPRDGKDDTLKVDSHWNDPDMVVLVVSDDLKLTVSAKQLRAAIDNATNNPRS